MTAVIRILKHGAEATTEALNSTGGLTFVVGVSIVIFAVWMYLYGSSAAGNSGGQS